MSDKSSVLKLSRFVSQTLTPDMQETTKQRGLSDLYRVFSTGLKPCAPIIYVIEIFAKTGSKMIRLS